MICPKCGIEIESVSTIKDNKKTKEREYYFDCGPCNITIIERVSLP